jgi:hypothetical protein
MSSLSREQFMSMKKTDAWGFDKDEPDWMENITLLLEAKATVMAMIEPDHHCDNLLFE